MVCGVSVEALNQFQNDTHTCGEGRGLEQEREELQLLVKSLVVHKKVNRQTNKQTTCKL